MNKLPIGIQTFAEIITEDYVYIDKTRQIAELIQAGKYLFLSRPRRFGKSLLISTLAELFSGNQALFQGLAIYEQVDWQPYPVIIIDFNSISCSDAEIFKTSLLTFLDDVAAKYELVLSKVFVKDKFIELISKIHDKTQQKVVILVDEYDKPIVNHIADRAQATQNREILRDFFGVLKSADAFIQFAFLTGVSKFAKVSVFSELNNLRDITLTPQFATLLGYTQTELETYFAPYIQDFCAESSMPQAELLAKIKYWYNGYSWDANNQMYNPFSILNLFAERQFDNYWFASGTPTFLINLIKDNEYDVTAFENKKITKIVFDSYRIEAMNVFALLFQTGYLTITHIDRLEDVAEYTLNYPNFEVKQAFITYLLEMFTDNGLEDIQPAASRLRHCLRVENMAEFMNLMRALFAKIPYVLHLEQEAYYHSLFYMIAVLMGVEIDLEVLTDKGRIDGVLSLKDKIYLLEFKYGKVGTQLDTLTEQAVQQIRNKHYGERFSDDARPRLLLGVGFVDKAMEYKLERVET